MSIVHGSVLQKWGFKPQGKRQTIEKKNKLVAQNCKQNISRIFSINHVDQINTHKR